MVKPDKTMHPVSALGKEHFAIKNIGSYGTSLLKYQPKSIRFSHRQTTTFHYYVGFSIA